VGKFPVTLIGAGFVLKSEPDFLWAALMKLQTMLVGIRKLRWFFPPACVW
jgi:hypothetical protein